MIKDRDSSKRAKKRGIHFSVTQFCITAVFMALTCIATMLIQIPIPLGYAHLGDSVILLCAYFFGPVVGALAGGIGSALADLLTGFPVWALPTLLIKTLMPLIACWFFSCKILPRNNIGKKFFSVSVLVGAVVTLLLMVAGYVVFGAILYGGWAAGIASAPGLLLKAVVNLAVFLFLGTGLSKVLKKNGL